MRFIPATFRPRSLSAAPAAAITAVAFLLGTTAPAAAVDYRPVATLNVTYGCVDGEFEMDIEMGNVQGEFPALFIASVSTGYTSWSAIEVVVATGEVDNSHLTGAEDFAVTLHITSEGSEVPIDYSLAVTADCQPNDTVPTTDTTPDTDDTTIDANSGANGSGAGAPGSLPSTGSSSVVASMVAAMLLLAGLALTRTTRRA